ncbi:MAG: glycosyltransferase [Deltaproteobacteria bacterium]|nr:glycosyltransferase [Deltaproteobacteria bacterium]
MSRKRVLFVSENITLAQVVRLVTLADALPSDLYDVHFACGDFPDLIFGPRPWKRWPLWTVPAKKVFRSLESGGKLYSGGVLRRYVQADLDVIKASQPDLIVGDLRWSLNVSAPVAGVRYASLINAYWSRHAKRDAFPLPDHPIVKWLGEDLAAKHFPKALPFVFKHFAAPLNKLRKQHNLSPLGDLLDVLMAGDDVLFADTPQLAPVKTLAANQRYLGPVLWSPAGPVSDDWKARRDHPKVYVTLGSSGRLSLVPTVVNALASMPVTALLATAGRWSRDDMPSNVTMLDYVDGAAASQHANVVITNGGSSTGYQALAQGRPVIGIPSNFDQYLASQAIEATGAGLTIPARRLTPLRLAAAIEQTITTSTFRSHAATLAHELGTYNAAGAFCDYVREATA